MNSASTADWPNQEWTEALNAWFESWESHRFSGVLFHQTTLDRVASIQSNGLCCTEGFVIPPGGLREEADFLPVVHLGTPEVIAWYARDDNREADLQPAFVMVDLAAYLESLGRERGRPDRRLAFDLNSIDFPPLQAIGAADVDEVTFAWDGKDCDWRTGFSLTRSVAIIPGLGRSYLPPTYLRLVTQPEELRQLAAQGFHSAVRNHPIIADIQDALARPVPWRQRGWRMDAAILRGLPGAPQLSAWPA